MRCSSPTRRFSDTLVAMATRASDEGKPRPQRNCLVVGGGLIGGHVACELAQQGMRVTVFSRSFNRWLRDQRARGIDLRLVEGTIPPGRDLPALAEEADVIFCFAGFSTPLLSAQDPAGAAANVTTPILTLLELARAASVRRMVFPSSGGTVYGRINEHPTTESHPTLPQSLHGVHSLGAERYAEFYRRVHGVETVALRFSNVYGPGEQARYGQGVIAAWCEAIAQGRPITLLGEGEMRRDFLHASDAARAAAAAALDLEEPGEYNVGSGESYSLAELLSLLGEVTGHRPQVERRPARPIDVPFTELDATRFRERTGWAPRVSLPEGLRSTWEWASSPAAR
jgi:UDP-glucose 4-epimerase